VVNRAPTPEAGPGLNDTSSSALVRQSGVTAAMPVSGAVVLL